MAEFLRFESDFRTLSGNLRKAAPEIERRMRRELRDLAAGVVKDAREKVPSGMKSAAAKGMKWGYYGSKGAYMKAGARSKPGSWIGAYEGGLGGRKGFRHPVYPSAGEPRQKWHWAGAHGQKFQTPGAPLQKTWLKVRPELVARSELAIARALSAAGLGGE